MTPFFTGPRRCTLGNSADAGICPQHHQRVPCGILCAGRAMLSPLEGLRTSAARTTSCWTGCAVAVAALRQRCALGNWAGAMQERRKCQRPRLSLARDSVAERAMLSALSLISAGVVDTRVLQDGGFSCFSDNTMMVSSAGLLVVPWSKIETKLRKLKRLAIR